MSPDKHSHLTLKLQGLTSCQFPKHLWVALSKCTTMLPPYRHALSRLVKLVLCYQDLTGSITTSYGLYAAITVITYRFSQGWLAYITID